VLGRFLRTLALVLVVASVLLTIFEASDRKIPVLPADASPLGVILGAFACALVAAALEELLRRD
jgi:hypothetical protein